MGAIQLSQEQIDFFNEKGFIGGIKMLDDAQIERLRDELKDLTDPDSPGMIYSMNFTATNLPIRIRSYFMHWGLAYYTCLS
jgi:hypothetical protein